MDGARDRAASRCADVRAAILAVASRVENDRIRLAESIAHVTPSGQNPLIARAGPIGGPRRLGFLRHRQTSFHPRLVTAVKNAAVRVTEKLEKPERPRRSDPGGVVVDNDRYIVRHTARREEMLDDPEERVQRRRIRIDAADTEQIEVNSARQMVARRTASAGRKIDQKRSSVKTRDRVTDRLA